MRLNDADAAKKALVGWKTDPTDEEIERAIDYISTIEAKPVRHGEWIDSTVCVGFYECSKCRTRKRGNQPFFNNVWNYCPNCGAKMDGGKQDENV